MPKKMWGRALLCLLLLMVGCIGRPPSPVTPPPLALPHVQLVDIPLFRESPVTTLSWSPDSERLLITGVYDGAYRVFIRDLKDERVRILVTLPPKADPRDEGGFSVLANGAWSPNGQEVAFSKVGRSSSALSSTLPPDLGDFDSGLWVFDLGAGQARWLVSSVYNFVWGANSESLVTSTCFIDGTLVGDRICRLDSVTGEIRSIVTPLLPDPLSGASLLGLSALSPAGQHVGVALQSSEASFHICIVSLITGETRCVENVNGLLAGWNPTGETIAFRDITPEQGATGLYVVNSDGTCARSLLDLPEIGSTAWSPDGRKIAFSYEGRIYLLDVVAVLGEEILEGGLTCEPND